MAGGSPQDDESLDPVLLEQIDRLCDTFEEAWKSGEAPSIEECLPGVAEPTRDILLRQLIELDIEYRRRRGQAPARPIFQCGYRTDGGHR